MPGGMVDDCTEALIWRRDIPEDVIGEICFRNRYQRKGAIERQSVLRVDENPRRHV